MTDKQIIIDECNVSECKYFNGYQRIVRNNECIVDMQNACIEEIKTKPCSQKHNCYFKNWQRKEQECERLKHDNGYEVGALEKTIDNLKAELEAERNWHKTSDEISKVNSEYTAKLKRILAEIKKLVEKEFCRHIECCEFCANSNDCINQKIIEKINEVENEL